MPRPANTSANASGNDDTTLSKRKRKQKIPLDPSCVTSYMGFYVRPDGALLIRVERNRRNNFLSPPPDKIEQALTSSTFPIVIDLWEDQPDKKNDLVQRNELVSYFRVFLNFIHRWKEIRFWAPWVITPESFRGRQFLPAPWLESIELGGPAGFNTLEVAKMLSSCWSPVTFQHQGVPVSTLSSSPLQRFTIRDRRFSCKISSVQASLTEFIPMKQLTTLVMENLMSGLDCNRVLSETADNIVNCAFINIAIDTAAQANKSRLQYTQVTCSQMKSFYLGSNVVDGMRGRNCLDQILLYTTAPKLLALTLCHVHLDREISTFIARSHCPLEALQLYLTPQDDLLSILALTPTLRVLKIFEERSQGMQSLSRDVCDGLTIRDFGRWTQILPSDCSILCPALEMLLMDEHTISTLIPGQMARMVESRINRSPLKFVWIANQQDWDPTSLRMKVIDRVSPSTTMLSEEDLQKFTALRGGFSRKKLKHLVIDHCGDRSSEWNQEVMATLKITGWILTEAKEPTVFEYPREGLSVETSVMQQMPGPSTSNQGFNFMPVGERIAGNHTLQSAHNSALGQNIGGMSMILADYAGMQDMVPDGLYAASFPANMASAGLRAMAPTRVPDMASITVPAMGPITVPTMAPTSVPAIALTSAPAIAPTSVPTIASSTAPQSTPPSSPMYEPYEPPQYPEYRPFGIYGNWMQDPFQLEHADVTNMNINWMDTTLSNCDHINCSCLWNGFEGSTM